MSSPATAAPIPPQSLEAEEQLHNFEGGLGIEFERLLHTIDARKAAESRRGLRALALAPTLDLYQALIRGEHVPLDQLNQDAVKRYGLRR